MNDLRFAFRQLRKSPGFTAAAVLTLGLGIGANTAVFTLINALLLRTLPGVRDPQLLVLVTDGGELPLAYLAYPHYEQLRDQCRSFSGLCATAQIRNRDLRVVGSGGLAESIQAQAVSGNFFDVLGTRVVCGRSLIPSDDHPQGSPPVAVISHGFWERRFGLDPTAI